VIQGREDAPPAEIMTPETPIRLEFDRPPLIEQAISVSFDPIERFRIVDYGLYWAELRGEFPNVSSDNPLPTLVETFDELQTPSVNFSLMERLPLPRAMFRNDRGELVQVQPDRFAFNWAKEGDADYPRSERVMARFEELIEKFIGYLRGRKLGELKVRQCELTNLNILPVAEFGSSYGDMTKALVVNPLDLGLPFLKPETYNRNRQHRIVGADGKPIGRLHSVISPVVSNQDRSQAFKLELTARSAPIINTLDDARWFFGVARNVINGAFRATVTPEMRKRWGERDA